jgi:hypothetical protein
MILKQALAFLIILVLPGMTFAVDVALEFEPFTQEKGTDCCPSFSVEVKKSLDKPEGSWSLPSFKSEFPVYALVALGDEERLLVLDQQSKDDLFYSRVYFDANANKDLTDDPVIDEEAPDEEGGHVYAVEGIALKAGNNSYKYSFRLNVEYKGRKNKKPSEAGVKRSLKLHLEPACWYRGRLDLEGGKYDICLMDQNGNGKFDDAAVLPDLAALATGTTMELVGDGLYIASGGEICPDFSLIVGDLLVVGNKTFRFDVRVEEELLTLAACDEAVARISLPMEAEQIGLFDPDNRRCVMIYGPGKEVALPPGKYHMYGYRALRKDAQGDLWSLIAAATRDTPGVRLVDGQKPTLKFGEPFKPFGEVPEWSIAGVQKGFSQQASIEFVIEGSGGERVTDEPRFKVMETGGDVAAQGEFKYG